MLRGKRKLMVVVAVIAVLAIGGAAYAFWTNTGSGTGTATTGSNNPITVNQTSTITGLAPGAPAQTLSGTFDNGNNSNVHITAVTATVTGTNTPGCDASDYTIGGSAPVNADIPPGTGVGTWSGLTIQFNNKPTVNQDACKNAVVSIQYSAS
jgi:Tfp pilus assembly major pilin PilA